MSGGYVPVGGGIGAAVLWNGMLNAISGPLFAQIERERTDGPRFCEAVRGARVMRRQAWDASDWYRTRPDNYEWQRRWGMPEGWISSSAPGFRGSDSPGGQQ